MEYLSEKGIKVQSSGKQVKTLCPQCSAGRKNSKDKCLSVNTVEKVWHCHNCGWSGGLGGKKYAIPDFKPAEKINDKVLKYFSDRGISEQTLKTEGVTTKSSGKGSVIRFPYYKNSVAVNVKNRTGDKKFWQEAGSEQVLYRYDTIRQKTDEPLVICEGEMDALSLVEAGVKFATSIPDGAPAENTKNLDTKFKFLNSAQEVLSQYQKIILWTDQDGPGQLAEKELARRLGAERCYKAKPIEGCKDANEVLVKHGKDVVKDCIDKAVQFPVAGIIHAGDVSREILEYYNNGMQRGCLQGWKSFDQLYSVKEGEVTIVTGTPSAGKSEFLDNILLNLMKNYNFKTAIFSPENWPIKIHSVKLVEKLIGKPQTSKYGNATLEPNELKEGVEIVNEYFPFIVTGEDDLNTIDFILEKARVCILREGIKGLVIDPWAEIHVEIGERTETQDISRQLTKVRKFARLNGVHVWIVAHPQKLHKNSSGKYSVPTMYQISGGAHWFNKADVGLCVYRDFESNQTTVYTQKVRFKETGQLGSCVFTHSESGNYFEAY